MTETTPRDSMPRDGLIRANDHGLQLERQEDAAAAAMPTLVGEFAVFNQWTEINSMFEGRFMEQIAPGAFKKTFKENRQAMRVLFQHGKDPQIANKPLGPINDVRETDSGAYYEVPLLDTQYTRDLIPGLDAGLYGSSFRFQVMQEEIVTEPKRSKVNPDGLPERTITEAKVMEFGPVTFPAYAGASSGLRSATDWWLEQNLLGTIDVLAGRAAALEEPAEVEATDATPVSRSTRATRTYLQTPRKERRPWELP